MVHYASSVFSVQGHSQLKGIFTYFGNFCCTNIMNKHSHYSYAILYQNNEQKFNEE